MQNPFPRRAAANPTQYNIDAIAKLEHDALHGRTATERASDLITKLIGNVEFLIAQLLLISGWCLVNLHMIPGLNAFDPFPFGVLALGSGITTAPLVDWDEATYAEVAHEAVANHSYLDFTWNGQAYAKKPPLLFWAMVASFKVLGESEFAARLPSVAAGLATLLLIYLTAAGAAVHGFLHLLSVPLGYDPHNVVSAGVPAACSGEM